MTRPFAAASASTGDGGDTPVLLIASDEILLDSLLRVTAAAGVSAVVVGDPSHVGRGWLAARLVLVAAVDLAALGVSGLPRRPGVVVVGRGEEDPAIWRAAMEAGAQSVVWLPAAEAWLVQSISEAARQGRHDCPVLVVVGARGGSGASTLAAALARTAAGEALSSYLVDLDPLAAGLDVVLGVDGVPGLKWHDLGSAIGRVPSAALRDGLPMLDGVRLLTFDRGRSVPPLAGVVGSVIDAARRDADVVVVDLPRWLLAPSSTSSDGAPALALEVLSRASQVVVICAADVRSALAAGRLVTGDPLSGFRVGLVVRGPSPGGLTGSDIARAAGVPLLATMVPERGLDRRLEDAEAPGNRDRGPLAGTSRRLLRSLAREASSSGVGRA